MSATAVELPRRRARLAAYAPWQARDFVINVGLIALLLFGLLGAVLLMNLHGEEAMARMNHSVMPVESKLKEFLLIWGMFAAVGPIIAATGVVSQDRALGYTRFLFAKPLSPRRFYLQAWLIRFAGFMVLGTMLMLAYAQFEPPAFSSRVVVDLALSFVAIGGIVFLISAVTRFDGLIAAIFLLVADAVWSKWEYTTGFGHGLTYLLPPVSHLGAQHDWLVQLNVLGRVSTMPFPTKWVLWNAGYGLACLLLGLYLLRKVPLTKA